MCYQNIFMQLPWTIFLYKFIELNKFILDIRSFWIEPRIEYFRSFSVVPPCEAFASLFLNTVLDYRQKKPLKYSIFGYQHYE